MCVQPCCNSATCSSTQSYATEIFATNQPAHYTVDADYVKGKGSLSSFNLGLTGQFENTEQLLTVGMQRLHDGVGMFPDLAFFDCQSCHHSLEKMRWAKIVDPKVL
jgi:hypothetical protein